MSEIGHVVWLTASSDGRCTDWKVQWFAPRRFAGHLGHAQFAVAGIWCHSRRCLPDRPTGIWGHLKRTVADLLDQKVLFGVTWEDHTLPVTAFQYRLANTEPQATLQIFCINHPELYS